MSKDNPCDTDCLILPEPNCDRDKGRVKDVPAHCSLHPSSGEQKTPLLWHPALLRRGRARLRIHSLEVRPGHRLFHSPRASLIPSTQKAVRPPARPSLPHTLLLLQLPSCCRNVSPADTRTLSGPIRLGKRLGPTPTPGPKQQQQGLEALSWGEQESKLSCEDWGKKELLSPKGRPRSGWPLKVPRTQKEPNDDPCQGPPPHTCQGGV